MLLHRGADEHEGSVVHARAARSEASRAHLVPARRAGQGRDARGGGERRSRGRAARREPGGVLPRRRRLSRVPRRATDSSRAPARSSTSTAKTLGDHDGFWRFTPGQRKGIGVSAPTPLYVLDADAASNAVIVGPHESLARRRVDASGTALRRRGPRGREAQVSLAGRRRERVAAGGRFHARARRARLRRCARAGRCSLRRRRRRRVRSHLSRRG